MLVLALLLLPGSARAQGVGSERVGTSGGNFLKIGVGARAVGMGEAFVAVANDPSTIYWNSAGVASLIRSEALVSHVEWPASISYEHLTYIHPSKKLGGSLGFQLGLLHTDIEETSEEHPFGTGQTFTYADWNAGVTYGRRLTDRLLIGVGGKVVHGTSPTSGARRSTLAIDIGSIYYLGISRPRIGMALSHRARRLSASSRRPPAGPRLHNFSPPTTFRFYVAWDRSRRRPSA